MKTTAKVLDIIGAIFLGSMIIGYIVSLACASLIAEVAYQSSVRWLEEAQMDIPQTFTAITVKTTIVSTSVWGLVMSIVTFVLGLIAAINVFQEKPGKTYHILAIVSGAVGGTGFLIAGGILGLIASRHEERNNQIQVKIEKPSEEVIVEVESEK